MIKMKNKSLFLSVLLILVFFCVQSMGEEKERQRLKSETRVREKVKKYSNGDFSLVTDILAATLKIAKERYSL